MFKFWYCKSRMVAFINDELTPRAKRQVARYIDECPRCYTLYQRQRRLALDLSARLPTFGQPGATQLQGIWAAVQAEINSPPPRPRRVYRTSYAIVALATALVIILPLMLGNTAVSAGAQTTLPEPMTRLALATTVTPANTAQIAATAEAQMTDEGEVTLAVTPRPVLEPDEH